MTRAVPTPRSWTGSSPLGAVRRNPVTSSTRSTRLVSPPDSSTAPRTCWRTRTSRHVSRSSGSNTKCSANSRCVRALGPELGEHNTAVYRDLLGLSDDEVEALRTDAII